MIRKKYNQKKAQSFLEYSLLIAVSLGVFVIMWNYMNRGLQGNLKSEADKLAGDYSPRVGSGHVSKSSSSFTFEDGLTPIGLVVSSGSSSRIESRSIGPLSGE